MDPTEGATPCDGALLGWDDVDEFAASSAILELHDPRHLGKQGIVLAPTYIEPWVELRATLPNQNGAAIDGLTAVSLDTEKLRIRIAAIAAGALSFFVCHNSQASAFFSVSSVFGFLAALARPALMLSIFTRRRS